MRGESAGKRPEEIAIQWKNGQGEVDAIQWRIVG
jgi:hypothetical protein